MLGHRVQRPGDLDVVVAVHLDPGEDRLVVGLGHRQQTAGLELGEQLGRPPRGGAVDPHPGPLPAPRLGPGLGVGQVGEGLPGPEVAADVLHRPFHPRLVLRGADPGRVGAEPDMLGVVQPARRQPRVDRIGLGDHGLQVVGDQHLERAAEERPRRLAAGDHRGQGLGVGQPHEHVPRHHGGEDQRVHPPLSPGLGVAEQHRAGRSRSGTPPPARRRRPGPWWNRPGTRTAPPRTGAASGRAPPPRGGPAAARSSRSTTGHASARRPRRRATQPRICSSWPSSASHDAPCPFGRAGRTASTTSPTSSSVTASGPASRDSPAASARRHTGGRSCGPPPPCSRPSAARGPPATPAAPHAPRPH